MLNLLSFIRDTSPDEASVITPIEGNEGSEGVEIEIENEKKRKSQGEVLARNQNKRIKAIKYHQIEEQKYLKIS